ncbi:MAG: DUF1592 domain-containing protein [Pirellulales bacterium]|nr:DUF1592 domain-containing protein [Pirellulales bacterium]
MSRFRYKTTVTAAALAAILPAIHALGQEEADPFKERVRPVLEAVCLSCHTGDDSEGGLDLARFQREAGALQAPEVWEKVSQRINLNEMPPEGSPGLPDEQRKALVQWIDANRKADEDCTRLATDGTQSNYLGHVMSRRLSRTEYNNTIRDLIGLDLRPADLFPSDGSGGEGFDNVGDTLFVSSVQLENYLTAATKVLDAAMAAGMTNSQMTNNKGIPSPRERILVAEPSDHLSPREAAGEIVHEFAERAFRRPVKDAEVERLLTMFDRGANRGDEFENSVKLALTAVLISPSFLFLVEQEPEAEGVYRLGHYELASRLSYFLWASMPDKELLDLAAEEQLYDEEVTRGQVRRMLADPKARGFADSFATQWLGIGSLGQTVKPDPERFPQFNAELGEDMRAEAVGLVETILREDRSVLELLDCDYTLLNERLAAHYGLPPVEGDELRRVPLEDRRRGGVLGLGAVLTNTSFPLRTSPVLRGKWVLEQLLGAHIPPPPPDAGVLPEDDRTHAGLTLREQLEAHRTKPECAACHQRMDPLGFGLESFDAIGRWRHHSNGLSVDARGELPSGEAFTGPAELKQVLLSRKQEFLSNLSRKMFGYAMGRGLGRFDECVIKDCVKALEANEYRSSVLVEEIVLSYAFQHRYGKK